MSRYKFPIADYGVLGNMTITSLAIVEPELQTAGEEEIYKNLFSLKGALNAPDCTMSN